MAAYNPLTPVMLLYPKITLLALQKVKRSTVSLMFTTILSWNCLINFWYWGRFPQNFLISVISILKYCTTDCFRFWNKWSILDWHVWMEICTCTCWCNFRIWFWYETSRSHFFRFTIITINIICINYDLAFEIDIYLYLILVPQVLLFPEFY